MLHVSRVYFEIDQMQHTLYSNIKYFDNKLQ